MSARFGRLDALPNIAGGCVWSPVEGDGDEFDKMHALNVKTARRIVAGKAHQGDAGFGCPNHDGSLARSGCLFCNARGSGTGLAARGLDLVAQGRV